VGKGEKEVPFTGRKSKDKLGIQEAPQGRSAEQQQGVYMCALLYAVVFYGGQTTTQKQHSLCREILKRSTQLDCKNV
jgi:hypothetical protein